MTNNPPHIDKHLLSLVADGDEKAFSVLYYEMLPVLHSFLLKMLKSETEVEEGIQLAFIRVWMNRDQLPDIENPAGWIAKVALNECYKLLRKQSRIKKHEVLQPYAEPAGSDAATDRLSVSETKQLISDAIEELPEKRKQIFKMSREQGLKIPEIADQLELSPGYVKNALTLSLQHLRKRLGKAGDIAILLILLKNQ